MVKPPVVKINEIPLALGMEAFSWVMQAGVAPFLGYLICPESQVEAIGALPNPVTLTIESSKDGRNGVETKVIKFENLWILDMMPLGGSFRNGWYKFSLTDSRWKWDRKIMNLRANHLIRLNDADIAEKGANIQVPSEGDAGAGEGDLNVNGAPVVEGAKSGVALQPIVDPQTGRVLGFSNVDVIGKNLVIPKYAYREYTRNPATDEAWTALELAEAILTGYTAKDYSTGQEFEEPGLIDEDAYGGRLPNTGSNSPFDNEDHLTSVSWVGMQKTEALRKALSRARVNLMQLPDGKIYLYQIDTPSAEPFLPPDWRKTIQDSGTPYIHYFSRKRPSEIHVFYRKEMEQLWRSVTATEVTTPDEFIIDNVVRTPVTFTYRNVRHEKGTLVNIHTYMSNLGIDEAELREHYFDVPDLATWYSANHQGSGQFPSQRTVAQLEALRRDYRTLYMLGPEWRDRIVNFTAEMATKLDPISGKRNPSEVYCAYTLIRSIRGLIDEDAAALEDRELFKNVEFKQSGGVPDDDQEPAPFLVQVEDDELGVFRVVPAQENEGLALGFELSNIEARQDGGLPTPFISDTMYNLSNCKLKDDFRLSTYLTLMRGDPNTKDCLHKHTISCEDIAGAPCLGEPLEIYVDDETARFDFEDTLVNEKMIKNRSDAEARAVLRTWVDRWAGSISFAGTQEIQPFGTVERIVYSYDARRGIITSLEMPLPIIKPEVGLLMPEPLRAEMEKRPVIQQ